MRVFIPIKLRTCTRCGHEECPCCRDFCDDIRCIDTEDDTPCVIDMQCAYAEPADDVGYAKLDEVKKSGARISRVRGGLLVYDDKGIPTKEELEAMR